MTKFKNLTQLITFSLLILLIAGSCKKKKAFKNETAQNSVDVRMFQGQVDEAMADVNLAIMRQPLMRGRGTDVNGTAVVPICGLTQDTSLIFNGIIQLKYDGTLCNGIMRTGTVMASIMEYPLKKWKNAGTTLKIDFLAYKAVWASDGRAIQIDGTVFLKNESGKTWYDLQYLNESSLAQLLTGNTLKATFSIDNKASFNVNRRMEYTYDSDAEVTTCKIDGLGSSDGQSSLESWGFTRDGEKFTCKVSSPLIWKTSCGAMALIDGEVVIDVENVEHNLNCNFSVDKNGNNVSTASPCPYGWQVNWSYKNKSNSRIFSYY